MSIPFVICCWEHVPGGKGPETWSLHHSYAADDEGEPILRGIQNWESWTTAYRKADDGYDDPDAIMGRAVTRWTFSGGVDLLAFNPPEWISWATPEFYERFVKRKSDWYLLLQGGMEMLLKTLKEADRFVAESYE